MKIISWLEKKENFPILVILFIVLCLWVSNMVLLMNNTDRGSFGDMFGSVNALFSGLAFAGVIYAILLQRQELQLQRQELRLTRIELKRSAEAQEASEKALKMQADSFMLTTEINTIHALIEILNAEINELLNKQKNPINDTKMQLEKQARGLEIAKLNRKVSLLKQRIKNYYSNIIEE